jgi:[ribosomal protein S18]-alanine N-acetyltransferase
LLSAAKERNGEAVLLEVRESNLAARRLYEKTGFVQAGVRKSYYVNPLEDAILYRYDLP